MLRGACLAFVLATALVGTDRDAAAQATAQVTGAARPARLASSGQVFLLRGLIDVFSQGMDDMGAKLRARGIASTVINHSAHESLAAEAIARYRAGYRGPIVIAGHSLGADAAMQMAQLLNEAKVPVALVVGFGPTLHLKAPANVAHVVNYYQAHSMWNGVFSPGPGFRGTLANVNLDNASDITHFNIDKIARLHDQTIRRIVAIMGPRKPTAAASAGSPVRTAVPAAAESKPY
jgi:pimeloyl-ACP methyl ester carboxylesterase